MQYCGQEAPKMTESNGHRNIMDRNHQVPVFMSQGRTEGGWTHPSAPQQTTTPTMPSFPVSAPYVFRSPESVEMDEIMAAMVLTSLSCSPVVQSPPQSQNVSLPGPSSGGGDMECGGGELSDSGSSGYWSWDHGNVSPASSSSVTDMDSSPDEGLHMELEQGVELHATKKSKSYFGGAYRCLWPSCGKVLTSSVGMKSHVRVLHLGSVSEQSHREEDFYYTKITCEAPPTPVPASSPHVTWVSCGSLLPPAPVPASSPHIPCASCGSLLPPAPVPGSSPHVPCASCGSPPGPGPGSVLQIPSSTSSSSGSGSSRSSSAPGSAPGSDPGSAPGQPSPLSQSAPSSFWQIHKDHLYQVSCCLTPPRLPVSNQHSHHNSQVVTGRRRSLSVGEQWLQQNSATNKLTAMSAASPSRSHSSFRKRRGEARKCRKVYGVERKEQWCTACRWKKACQRFPD